MIYRHVKNEKFNNKKKANEIIKEHLNTLSDEEIDQYLRGRLHNRHLCPTKKIREMADAVVDYFFNKKSYEKAIGKADVISAYVEHIKIKSKIGIDIHGLINAMGRDFLFEVGLQIYQNYGREIPAMPTKGVVDRTYIDYKIFEESVCLLVCVLFYTKLIRYLHPYRLGVERRKSLLCQLLNKKRNVENSETAD